MGGRQFNPVHEYNRPRPVTSSPSSSLQPLTVNDLRGKTPFRRGRGVNQCVLSVYFEGRRAEPLTGLAEQHALGPFTL